MIRAGFIAAVGAASLVACDGSGGRSPGNDAGPPLVFDRDVRAAYTQVRDCRSPGEHSGVDAFTVWISKGAAGAFASLWQEPAAIERLPDGTVIVKEVYSGTDCTTDPVARWVAMRKEKGFDPAHADWHWQEVTADGTVKTDGATKACIDCHAGHDDASCIGYGEQHGRDYTCTSP